MKGSLRGRNPLWVFRAVGEEGGDSYTAATVAVEGVEHAVLVIDPSLSQTGPMTLSQWAGTMRARLIEVSEVPLSQSEILIRQTTRALAGQDLDAIVFSLARGQA